MKLCMKHKKDFDVRGFELLIAQIKVMEEDFFESQLYMARNSDTSSQWRQRANDGSTLLSARQMRGTTS